MPVARFQMPDGRIGRFEVPEGTSPEDAQNMIQSSLDQMKKPQEGSSVAERIGTGLGDVVWGAGQLAAHMLPHGTVRTDIVDQMVKDRESEYQAKRAAAGSEGVDWARMAGNVANPVNYYLAGGGIAAPATLLGRAALGAAGGMTSGLLSPTTNTEDFAAEKGKQATVGALTGAAVPAVGAGISRVINPQTTDAVKNLANQGINPTLGQILGGPAKSMEDKMMSIPIVGDVIAYGRRGAIDDMNKALYNMALEPIGQQSTARVGREAVKEVRDKLSAEYGNLLKGKQVTIDPVFNQDISHIWNQTTIMSDEARKQFLNILRSKVIHPIQNANGQIDGEMMNALDVQLGQMARGFNKEQSVNSQWLGDALGLVQQSLRNAVERSHPDLADGLNNVRQGWAVYARIRNAAATKGSKEGIVMPGTLKAAVRNLDNTVAKGGTATGTGFMQKFADDVESTLGNQYPDSGTAGRALMSLLLYGGGAMLHPAGIALSAAAALPSLMRKPITAAMTNRPAIAAPIANAAEQAARYIAPGMGVNQ